jgi:hypothetical protein
MLPVGAQSPLAGIWGQQNRSTRTDLQAEPWLSIVGKMLKAQPECVGPHSHEHGPPLTAPLSGPLSGPLAGTQSPLAGPENRLTAGADAT